MIDATRMPLPDRRHVINEKITLRGMALQLSIGLCPDTGRIKELFIASTKSGTDMDAILRDAAIWLSLCLQLGATPADMAKSLGRVPVHPITPQQIEAELTGEMETKPASILGEIAEHLAQFQADLDTMQARHQQVRHA